METSRLQLPSVAFITQGYEDQDECCPGPGGFPPVVGPLCVAAKNTSRREKICCFCALLWALFISLLFFHLYLFNVTVVMGLSPRTNWTCRRYAVDMAPENENRCKGPSKELYDSMGRRIHRISFIGDSLTADTNAKSDFIHHIILRLRSTYPTLAFDAVEAGVGADRIFRIMHRIHSQCLAYSPDVVMLYYDSDAADQEIEKVDTDESKSNYEKNLFIVIETLLKNNVSMVGLAGPTILGEMPAGANIIPWNRDAILEKYLAINQRVCGKFPASCTIIRTREAFLQADAHWGGESGPRYPWPSGYLTQDGEHHSLAGAAIIEKLFGDMLVDYYRIVSLNSGNT